MTTKFKLTAEYIERYNRKAFKIIATADFDLPWPFGKIKKGDLGGYVEKEEFLTHGGRGWVFPGGEIWGGVIHDGVIRGGVIRGGVIRGGEIWGGEIWGGVIHGGVIRGGVIWGGVIRGGVIHDGVIRGGVIHGGVIRGGVIWGGVIRGGEDVFFVGHVGSSLETLTATRQADGNFRIYRGCFNGTLKEFKTAVRQRHKKSKIAKQYLMLADAIEFHFTKLHPYEARKCQ